MLIKIIVTAINFLLVSISCELSAGTKVVPALVITGIRTVIRTVESVGRRIIIFICIARTLKPQPLVILAGSVVLVSKIVDIAVLFIPSGRHPSVFIKIICFPIDFFGC